MKSLLPKTILMGMLLASVAPVMAMEDGRSGSKTPPSGYDEKTFQGKFVLAFAAALAGVALNKTIDGAIYLGKWYFSKPEPKAPQKNPIAIMLEQQESTLNAESEALKNLSMATQVACEGGNAELGAKLKQKLAVAMQAHYENRQALQDFKEFIMQQSSAPAQRSEASRAEPVTLADSMKVSAVDLKKASA